MDISIIGAGNMGKGLAALFAQAGHRVTLAARDVAKAEAAARAIGSGVVGVAVSDAADADVVVLAVPYEGAAEAINAAGGLSGKVVVDITNPMKADYSGLSIGHTTSAAEEIQKHAPQARVVKAFNTIFAQVLQNGGKAGGRAATTDTGSLVTARFLEPVAALNITLGYGLGHGTDMAPTWQRAA